MDNGRFNLITEAWLPVIRASGRGAHVRLDQLTDRIADDPILDLDFPRPDFRCATLEYLIGLLTVACPSSQRLGCMVEGAPIACGTRSGIRFV